MYVLYLAVNTSQLRCPIMTASTEQVCGKNGRTYPSVCHLLQQSNSQVRFSGPCNRTDCPDQPVSVLTMFMC